MDNERKTEKLNKRLGISEETAKELLKKAEGTAKKIVEEVEKPKLTATEQVIKDLNEKIEEAEESGSYFVAITRKEGEKLFHWQGRINLPKDDCAHSLREQLKLTPSAFKNETGNVRKFGPSKPGG